MTFRVDWQSLAVVFGVLFGRVLGTTISSSASSTSSALYPISTNSCYFPDSKVASDYVPCSAGGDGDCCVHGDYCTTYGYCLSVTVGYHYRGACTDPNWLNPSCPDYCLNGTNAGNTTAVNVIACSGQVGGSWCCAYDGNCCSNTTFSLQAVDFQGLYAEGEMGANTTQSTIPSATAAGSASAAPSASSSASSSNNTATIVGCAVGIPLGLAALAGLMFFYTERRRRLGTETAQKQRFEELSARGTSGWTDAKASFQSPNELLSPANPTELTSPSHPRYELSTARPFEMGS